MSAADAALAAARLEGARAEREAIRARVLAAYQETHYEGPRAEALEDVLEWIDDRSRGE